MRTAVRLTVGVLVLTGMVLTGRAEAAMANGPYYAEPSWDQKLDAATRFVVLLNWNSEAVLDRETGLVWEKSPATNLTGWLFARGECTSRTTGGRKGWRLPSVHELASLVDPNAGGPPFLPPGHPFSNVQQIPAYWSATLDALNSNSAWFVFFQTGLVGTLTSSLANHVWCVRGGGPLPEY